MRRLLFLLLAMTWIVSAAAQIPALAPATDLAALDKALGEAFEKAKVPGASVAVIEHGEVALVRAYGLADVAASKPATPESVFRAGSISKSIVGIAVMMLVEEGRLDLDAKLSELAPELKFDNPWEGTDPVRLVHLMEHTSGFDDIGFHHYLLDGTRMPLLQAIGKYGPYRSRWKPGTYASYCNSGPVIAGYIVEKASGMSWADFTRTRIFEPLGMTSAYWDRDPAIAARIAKSYRSDGKTEEPYMDIPGKPAGALNVEARDLAKLALMLIGRGSYNGVTLLKPESVARLETPHTTLAARLGLAKGYGLGNMALPRAKGIFHGHDGGIDGFLSTYAYEADNAAGLVIMINAPQGEALQAAETIFAYLQRDWPEVPPVEIKPELAELEALTGIYQSMTPRQQQLAPLEALSNWTPVKVENGALVLNGSARRAVAPRIFQKLDRVAPNLVFNDTPEGMQMLTAMSADRRVPMSEIIAKATWGGLYVLATLFSLIYALVWLIAALRGKLRDRGGIAVRALPAMALFSMAAFAVVLLSALSSADALNDLGTASAAAWTLYALSIAFPVFGVAATLIGLRSPENTPRSVRALALLAGLLAITAAVWLWPYGWIGLKTWM
jgi:CubicO group peptidase (beta-lactamase class C family)